MDREVAEFKPPSKWIKWNLRNVEQKSVKIADQEWHSDDDPG